MILCSAKHKVVQAVSAVTSAPLTLFHSVHSQTDKTMVILSYIILAIFLAGFAYGVAGLLKELGK